MSLVLDLVGILVLKPSMDSLSTKFNELENILSNMSKYYIEIQKLIDLDKNSIHYTLHIVLAKINLYILQDSTNSYLLYNLKK